MASVDTGGPCGARPLRGLRASDAPGPRRPGVAPHGAGLLPGHPGREGVPAARVDFPAESLNPWRPMHTLPGRLARRCATPALLVGVMAAWFAVRSTGVPAVVCSVSVSVAAVIALLALEWLVPRPDAADRPAGTLVSDLGFNVLTM